jgi:fluoride exporter
VNDLPLLTQLLVIALGGGVGAMLRWGTTVWLNPMAWPFAAGTLAVNLVGGLLIGFSLVWFQRMPNELLRLALVTGLLGGLTTFSSFSSESLTLLMRGEVGVALAHTLVHVLGGLGCAALGWWLGRMVLG